MKQPLDLKNLTDEELVQAEKKRKAAYLTYSVILGLMVGVAIYSTVKKGLGFFTYFPLFFVPTGVVNRTNYNAVKKEITSRESLKNYKVLKYT